MAVFDNKEIGARLVSIREYLNYSVSRQFALEIGADVSFWGKLESGEKAVSEKYMEILRDRYNVNIVWLLFGIGEMFGSIGQNKKSGPFQAPDQELLTEIFKTHQHQTELLKKLSSNLKKQKSVLDEIPDLSEAEIQALADSRDSSNRGDVADQQTSKPKGSSRKKDN